MRRCLDPWADAMRGRPILVGGHVRVLPAHPLAPLTPAHLHGAALDFRLRLLRHVRYRHGIGPLPAQIPAATRALGDRHRNFHWRLTGRRRGRGTAEGKWTFPGLAARPLALGFPLGWPLRLPSPGRLQFLAKLFVLPTLPINLPLSLFQILTQGNDLRLTLFQLLPRVVRSLPLLFIVA